MSERSVKVALPDAVTTDNAGFPDQLTVSQMSGNSWEKEMRWAVNSKIMVRSRQTVTAQMLIQEKKLGAHFSMTTTVGGKIHVVTRDNQVAFVNSMSGDIYTICHDYNNYYFGKVSYKLIAQPKPCVQFVTKGTLHFRYGVNQKVVVT